MPASQLPLQSGADRARDNLREALRRRRFAEGAIAPAPTTAPGLRLVANRPDVERPTDALTMRHGIDLCQAVAVAVRWSQLARTPVHIAQTLLRGLGAGNPVRSRTGA
jgi:hypothetical protein